MQYLFVYLDRRKLSFCGNNEPRTAFRTFQDDVFVIISGYVFQRNRGNTRLVAQATSFADRTNYKVIRLVVIWCAIHKNHRSYPSKNFPNIIFVVSIIYEHMFFFKRVLQICVKKYKQALSRLLVSLQCSSTNRIARTFSCSDPFACRPILRP